ncbi:aminoglycoside phosphotransferase family protein [Pseudonocardia kunmingensis]|uniref:Ser/Thr protein kinase RdoA (MazF antagonist) n=1 Tax=Pseudonocardia kunmingensis TaxID=630975 RepID=A0A543DIA3_9PSEU|nr:aminoglycoside phosphotransferase family protein [Pseudonocardia kunmingensis]TQM09068.1 Ser/Thr protein kinase RdoA (MazF antagonist) [Pseudonocardia kunmingensis]
MATAALLQRVFGGRPSFARTPDGVSTQVYRVFRGTGTFYLRVAEEPGDDLRTEADLHDRLRGLGVRVAEVVHVEPFVAGIDRSVLITTEVPGTSLAEVGNPVAAVTVAEEAGRDLALLGTVPVDGYGFVRRCGPGWPLHAEYPRHDAFVTSDLPRPWPGALAALFGGRDLESLHGLVERERACPPDRAALAHGDFDVTPIFCADGRYTGLIDLGEIRGAEPLFDLGHFLLHDRETLPVTLLPAVLRGYQHVRPLPADHAATIRRSAVLLGLRQLCRWLGPPRGFGLDHPAVVGRARRISHLLGAAPPA